MIPITQAIPQAKLQRTNVLPGTAGAKQSLRIMRKIILAYRYNPMVIATARRIVNNYGIRAKDYVTQAQAILAWIQQNLAFVRDPRGIDLYMTPDVLLRTGAGDCDDFVILYCTMLETLGHPTALMAIQQPGFDTFSHVVALTRIGTRWVCADATEQNAPLGYCPPSVQTMVLYV